MWAHTALCLGCEYRYILQFISSFSFAQFLVKNYTETLELGDSRFLWILMDSYGFLWIPASVLLRSLTSGLTRTHLLGCSLSQHSTFVFTWTIGKKPTSPHLSSCQLAGWPVCMLMDGRAAPKQPGVSWIHVIAHALAEVLSICPSCSSRHSFHQNCRNFLH